MRPVRSGFRGLHGFAEVTSGCGVHRRGIQSDAAFAHGGGQHAALHNAACEARQCECTTDDEHGDHVP